MSAQKIVVYINETYALMLHLHTIRKRIAKPPTRRRRRTRTRQTQARSRQAELRRSAGNRQISSQGKLTACRRRKLASNDTDDGCRRSSNQLHHFRTQRKRLLHLVVRQLAQFAKVVASAEDGPFTSQDDYIWETVAMLSPCWRI